MPALRRRSPAKPHRTGGNAAGMAPDRRGKPDLLLLSIILLLALLAIGAAAYLHIHQLSPAASAAYTYNLVSTTLFRENHKITIDDKCTVFVGNVIHTIGTDAQCQLRCSTQCQTFSETMKSFSFAQGKGCNSCTCICQ